MEFFTTTFHRHCIGDVVFTSLFGKIIPAIVESVSLTKSNEHEAILYTCKMYDEDECYASKITEDNLHHSAESAAIDLIKRANAVADQIRPKQQDSAPQEHDAYELKGTEEDLPF